MRAVITFFTFILPVGILGYLFFGNIPTRSYEHQMVGEILIPKPVKAIRVKGYEIEKPSTQADDPIKPDGDLSVPTSVKTRLAYVLDPKPDNRFEPLIDEDGCLRGTHRLPGETTCIFEGH